MKSEAPDSPDETLIELKLARIDREWAEKREQFKVPMGRLPPALPSRDLERRTRITSVLIPVLVLGFGVWFVFLGMTQAAALLLPATVAVVAAVALHQLFRQRASTIARNLRAYEAAEASHAKARAALRARIAKAPTTK